MSESGKQKNKQAALDFYYAHREERLAYQKDYQRRRKRQYNKYQKEYYQKNKEHLNPQRYFYAQAKRDAVKVTKPLAKYLLDKIERVLKRKLKEIRKAEELFYSAVKKRDTPRGVSEIPPKVQSPKVQRIYDKYYQNKLMKKYQHSLPEPEPFSDIIVTKNGFMLNW